MTLLLQSLELLRRARALLHALEAGDPAASVAGESLGIARESVEESLAAEPPTALGRGRGQGPDLRLVRGGPDADSRGAERDTSVALERRTSDGPAKGAAAVPFLAGQGARLYSLDAWRRAHAGGPNPRAA